MKHALSVGFMLVPASGCFADHCEVHPYHCNYHYESPYYIKSLNTNSGDQFGSSVAISSDGSTLAIGAPYEDSRPSGFGTNLNSNSAKSAGAVYVYDQDTSGNWQARGFIKAPSELEDSVELGEGDNFGYRVALSGDGGVLAVGAPGAIGWAGIVCIYVQDDGSWTHEVCLRDDSQYDEVPQRGLFGSAVALSADGAVLAVGARYESSTTSNSGAAYIFERSGPDWSQTARLKASNSGANDLFGSSIALSSSGSTLAVGACLEDSSAKEIGGDETDDQNPDSGAVYVYQRISSGAWPQQAYIKAFNTWSEDRFGASVAISGDGDTLAVGAPYEGNAIVDVGAVYTYRRNSQNVWAPRDYIAPVASSFDEADRFGHSVALSDDGSVLAVGVYGEDGTSDGIGGGEDNSAPDSGAVYVFIDDGWFDPAQPLYVKSSNSGPYDHFGAAVGLSGDGQTLVVGAPHEDSTALGFGGDQINNWAVEAGAVYVY
jgi:hypothetical protein